MASTIRFALRESEIGRGTGVFVDPSPSPFDATRRYCEQLPASDVYNQAGVRFQAGDQVGAAKILERAAAAGNAVAQLRLASLYGAGDGVPQCAKTAMQWYARAAAQGEPEFQNQMGLFYELGQGVSEN